MRDTRLATTVLRAILTLTIFITVLSRVEAQDLQQFVESAQEYKISMGEKELKLRKKPILSWTNPARSNEKGGVFLWMNSGRPEVVASCFTYDRNGQAIERHEFHSLSVKALKAGVRDQMVWTPSQGIVFKPIPGAPEPSARPKQRQLQMKLLSRRFSGTLRSPGDVTQLRLLSAPLVTYEPTDQACEQGAIFSLAVGTDPEILLLIECRDDNDSGKPQYKYAFARYHYFEVSAKYKGKDVWRVKDESQIHFSDRGRFSQTRTRLYVSFDK